MNEAEFLASWRPWLRKVAADMTSRDPENLAAEGWVALWLALPIYDGRAPFNPWCKRVALNRMRNVIRDSHAALRDERRVDHYPDIGLVCDIVTTIDGVELAYHHGEIHAALDQLTERQRAYVVARFWGGLTYTELNERFDTRSSGAMWKRARRRLADELGHLAGAA